MHTMLAMARKSRVEMMETVFMVVQVDFDSDVVCLDVLVAFVC